MTRKHYQLLASALLTQQPPAGQDLEKHVQWCGDVQAIADVLEEDNPRFDRVRFLDAAGFHA